MKKERTTNGDGLLGMITYLQLKNLLKGLVNDDDADVFPYLVDFCVEIPVSSGEE